MLGTTKLSEIRRKLREGSFETIEFPLSYFDERIHAAEEHGESTVFFKRLRRLFQRSNRSRRQSGSTSTKSPAAIKDSIDGIKNLLEIANLLHDEAETMKRPAKGAKPGRRVEQTPKASKRVKRRATSASR